MAVEKQSYPLWDVTVRIIHWSLVLSLPLAWWTAEEDNYNWHSKIGYTVLILVATRIIWGIVGSRHARFSDFVVGPSAILTYLRGGGARSEGHNPLGGWAVVFLLALLFAQAFSGLFNSDDVLFNGPFYYAASSEFRDLMGVVHENVFDVLLALIIVHVAAVLFHQFRLREKLVQAMIRGWAEGKQGLSAPVPFWMALFIAVVLAVGFGVALEYAPQPQPMW